MNTFTDLNGAWDGRRSAFLCKIPGLYFFSFNARGVTKSRDKEDLWMYVRKIYATYHTYIHGWGEIWAKLKDCVVKCFSSILNTNPCLISSVSLMLNGVEVVSIGGANGSGSSNSILLALNRYDEVRLIN